MRNLSRSVSDEMMSFRPFGQKGARMAAFDRVLSGIPQMDPCFDNIHLGDNVVWRVDELDDVELLAGEKGLCE